MLPDDFSLKEVTNKLVWEEAVARFPEANFLQSWNWGEFHGQMGKQIKRFLIFKAETLAGLFQTIREPATRGPYLSIAGGPIIDWRNEELVRWLFLALKEESKLQKAWFLRFRPQVIRTQNLEELVIKNGAVLSPMLLTADLTLQLDLSLSEEEILAQMRKNHRNLIRRSDREGVVTQVSSDPSKIEEFWRWQQYLAEKHGFVPYPKDYLYKQFSTFVKDNQAEIISSYKDNKLLASAFVIFYNNEAAYHYGVSTPENDQYHGSYAVQWRAIKEAKARGCHTYNFWGIAPENDNQHRFAGVSMFKRGFGGQEIDYLPAHDLPVSKLYLLTNIFEQVRKRRRKL
jgi:lipid II:glycine glycyltransferase (peptidoglycan interpeptide bridge formation enzyme)